MQYHAKLHPGGPETRGEPSFRHPYIGLEYGSGRQVSYIYMLDLDIYAGQ